MYRYGVTMFGLEWNWRFGVRGFLPSVSHSVTFADKSTAKTVVTYHVY